MQKLSSQTNSEKSGGVTLREEWEIQVYMPVWV